MKVIVSGRNMDVTDAIRSHIEGKLEKFDKYFRSDVEAHATIGWQKNRRLVEITIPLKNDAFIRVEEIDDDMYAAIDLAMDKLFKQIKKHKTKLEKRYRQHETIKFEAIPEYTEEEQIHEVTKIKNFAVKPMDVEEAILQMELLGHYFYLFINGETDEYNVVYIRKDGTYGLIEPSVLLED